MSAHDLLALAVMVVTPLGFTFLFWRVDLIRRDERRGAFFWGHRTGAEEMRRSVVALLGSTTQTTADEVELTRRYMQAINRLERPDPMAKPSYMRAVDG